MENWTSYVRVKCIVDFDILYQSLIYLIAGGAHAWHSSVWGTSTYWPFWDVLASLVVWVKLFNHMKQKTCNFYYHFLIDIKKHQKITINSTIKFKMS